MGIAPRLMRHWDQNAGFAFMHQLGTVMFETAADQCLCADCASGRNGSQVWESDFDPINNPQWSLTKRRFIKVEDWVQCDHCRVRVASYFAICIDDEGGDFHDGLAYNPDKHLFWYTKEIDPDAVKRRLIEIFSTTDAIDFEPPEPSWQTSNRRTAELAAFADENLPSRIDGTIRVERICISEHLKVVCKIQTPKSGVGFSQYGVVEIGKPKETMVEVERIGDVLYQQVLADIGLCPPTVRLVV